MGNINFKEFDELHDYIRSFATELQFIQEGEGWLSEYGNEEDTTGVDGTDRGEDSLDDVDEKLDKLAKYINENQTDIL